MNRTLKITFLASLLVVGLAGRAAAQYAPAQPPSPPLPPIGGEQVVDPYRYPPIDNYYQQPGMPNQMDPRVRFELERQYRQLQMELERYYRQLQMQQQGYGLPQVPPYGPSLQPPSWPLPPIGGERWVEPLPWGPPQPIPPIRINGPGYGPRDPALRLPPPIGY